MIRHAKSSWTSTTLADFDRPLNERGFREAKLMGTVLSDKKNDFDIIISSSANRAITTAKIIANTIGFTNEIEQKRTIYGSSVNELFDIIIKLNNNMKSVAIFGHNPTLHILSEKLSNEEFNDFPTCSIAKINFDVNAWEKIISGNLEYFLFPTLFKPVN